MVTPGRSRADCRWWIAAIGVMAACLTAGCARTRSETSRRDRLAAELAETLRQEALEVEEASRRERLVTGLIQLRDLMGGAAVLKPTGPAPGGPDVPEPAGGSAPAPEWAMMFAPRSLVVGFFTRSRNFDEAPGDDGLEGGDGGQRRFGRGEAPRAVRRTGQHSFFEKRLKRLDQ